MTVLHTPVADPLFDLARFGTATAILDGDRVLTYTELDGLVARRCAELGSARRLVLLECAPALEPLVTYLAALRGQHPVLLAPALDGEAARRHHERLVASYDPDVCVTRGGGWSLDVRHERSAHELHPELAVLLGTSGSTGTPKLVRLSRENLLANATAIVGYLGLGATSRAATTLPFQYCFGLSVVNSHLVAGGSLWLTGSSVVDPGFWDDFAAAGATSIAGVPYTFELLERAGVDWLAAPGLRQVLQAGGRMEPSRVRAIAERATARGAELFVMYGQTEATARMAYLPPHLAAARPDCIGIPIEGGELRIDPSAGSGRRDGELVYSGANVMLGYAETPADLALGRTVTELRTGDLARQHDDGLFEITGRCNRIAKLYGVRLDLDHAERLLAEHHVRARLVAGDEQLRAFVLDPVEVGRVAGLLVAEHCLPAHAVTVQQVDEFPRTSSGKVDYAALTEIGTVPALPEPVDVRAAYAGVFGREVGDDETFVGLGGDSLSYVETFVRLERLLGEVPADWPHRTVTELAALRVRRRRRWALLEMPVFLRALAITFVVGSHTELWNLMGGAHTLLALYGFAVARFSLTAPARSTRIRALGRSVRELVIPGVLVVGVTALLLRTYDWPTVLLLNNVLGPDVWALDWQLWFLETATWSTVALLVLVALPTGRLIARFPFAAALVALALTLVLRELVQHEPATTLARYSLERTVWLVALGWLVQAARTRRQRWLVTLVVPLTVVGFFPENQPRELVVIAGILALLWIPAVLVPRPLDRLVTLIASASLFIYLTHWHVYPHLEQDHQLLAALASLTVGITVWRGYVATRRRLRRTRPADVHEPNISGVPSRT